MPDPAIRIDDVTHDFDGVRALDRLGLEVPEGSVFGFLGPNGAGKTTTINVLLGLLTPTSGRTEVLGFDTSAEGESVREHCGALLEDPGTYDNLTVAENLEFYGRLWRIPPDVRSSRAEELLAAMGLTERSDDVVGTWSTGMRRRLGLARALLHQPRLLFLDEPTAGLDVLAARDVRADLASTVRRTGMTVFLTTHNMAEAEQLCDTVAVLQRGHVIAVGPPDRLVAGDHEIVHIAGRGITAEAVDRITAHPGVASVERIDGRLEVDLAGAEVGDVVRLLVEGGASVEEVVRGQVSLEEAFVDLVREEA